jgi:hypothetical protein
LPGIEQRNKLNLKKDSGQAGMTEPGYFISGGIEEETQIFRQPKNIQLQ